jgi:hypothetical protein
MNSYQIDLARHALGLTRKKVSFRNHYCCSSGPDHLDWLVMVEDGDARRRIGHPLSDGDDVFWLTEQGARKALRSGERLCEEDFPAAALTSNEGRSHD